jgi:hypothetical protein
LILWKYTFILLETTVGNYIAIYPLQPLKLILFIFVEFQHYFIITLATILLSKRRLSARTIEKVLITELWASTVEPFVVVLVLNRRNFRKPILVWSQTFFNIFLNYIHFLLFLFMLKIWCFLFWLRRTELHAELSKRKFKILRI